MSGNLRRKISTTLSAVVPAGDTLVLDTIPLSEFRKLTYEIDLFNVLEDKYHSLIMRAIRHEGTVSDSIYGIIGTLLNFELNFKIVGTDAVLEVINNEAFALTVDIDKFF